MRLTTVPAPYFFNMDESAIPQTTIETVMDDMADMARSVDFDGYPRVESNDISQSIYIMFVAMMDPKSLSRTFS